MSSAESDLEAAIGAVRGLVEVGREEGQVQGSNPTKAELSSTSVTAETLDAVLRERLLSVSPEGNIADGEGVRWQFVEASMAALERLKAALAEAEEKGAMLSVKAEASVSSLMQTTIALGMLPSLLPGVGLAPEKRSKWARVCMEGKRGEGEEGGSGTKLIERKHRRLVAVTTFLLDVAASSPRLCNILFTRHLGDLLAALVQLAHAPLMRPKPETEAHSASDDKFVMTEEKYDHLRKEQACFASRLTRILNTVYQPTAIKYLLLLQTGGEAGSAHRKWVQRVCGELLSGRLTREGGVLNVMRAVVDVSSGSGCEDEASKFEVVAKVIASPPSNTYQDVEMYYTVICPQLLALLKVDSKSDDARQLERMAVACVRAVVERSPVHGRKCLLEPLMEPLLAASDSAAAIPNGSVVAGEVAVEECVLALHRVFVARGDPAPSFVVYLEPVFLTLLEMHCQITFGVSFLKPLVKELLLRFLRFCPVANAVAAIRAFAFSDLSELDEGDVSRKCRHRLPRRDLRFVSGDSGGLAAVAVEDGAAGEAAEERRFYVADDEKAIVVVDLMTQESKDKALGVEFFMGLLRDLMKVMSAVKSDCDEQVGEEGAVAAAPLARTPSEMERKLLEFASELDATMDRLRKNLMVIRLLGLMSEDEKLQESLMKDSSRLLDFICITLKRGAAIAAARKSRRDSRKTCKSEQELDEEEDEEYGSVMLETQSLNTALTLLAFKVTQAETSSEDWQRLQTALPDMAVLGEVHDDRKIRKLANQLSELVATHGVILEESSNIKSKCKELSDRTEQIHKLTDRLKGIATSTSKEEGEIGDDDDDDDNSGRSRFQEAMSNLSDALLPVRGHGLIELTKLLDEGDPEAVSNAGRVVDALRQNLEDDDSYIYLQAINGLVAAAALRPDMVLSLLTQEFAHVHERECVSEERAVKLRANIGEALARVTANLGEMTPKYRNELVNPFFGQMSHPDEMVRCSALSNLGEVCKNLRFSLGGIVQEVLTCLHHAIEFDRSMSVRRAAVLVVKLLLEGLRGADALAILDGAALRDVWRALTRLRDTETDEAMLAHVAAALEEVDAIAKQFFAPEQRMEKKIYVLEAPPNPFP